MNEIMKATTAHLDPMTVAQVFRASEMFPDIKSEAQACTKIIIGRGLGLNDFDAMSGLHIIKGKAVLAAHLMAAGIKRAGKYDYRAECSDMECTITFYGRTLDGKMEKIGVTTYSMEDAKRARLTGGDNWQKYPKAMLFARCISSGYKQHCPDALGSAPVYVEAHGEMEITDEEAPPQAPPQAIRAVIEPPKRQKSAKQSYIAAIAEWVGCKPADAVKPAMRTLAALSLPVDGTATDGQIEYAENWVRVRIEEGHTIDILDNPPKPTPVEAEVIEPKKTKKPVEQPALIATDSEEIPF